MRRAADAFACWGTADFLEGVQANAEHLLHYADPVGGARYHEVTKSPVGKLLEQLPHPKHGPKPHSCTVPQDSDDE